MTRETLRDVEGQSCGQRRPVGGTWYKRVQHVRSELGRPFLPRLFTRAASQGQLEYLRSSAGPGHGYFPSEGLEVIFKYSDLGGGGRWYWDRGFFSTASPRECFHPLPLWHPRCQAGPTTLPHVGCWGAALRFSVLGDCSDLCSLNSWGSGREGGELSTRQGLELPRSVFRKVAVAKI